MEEKKLTGAESLELISRMIETTKKRMEVGSGNKFLLYGYSAVALSVAVFLLVRFTGDPRWNFAWFLMFIPGMVDAAASRKRRPAVVTYMDGVLSGMWWIVGALFFLTVIVLCAMAFVYGVADFSLMLPLGLLYACFGTSVTGIVIKEPWLVCMPLVGFGTWTLRGESGKRCILDALETGYRLLDTAQMYENEGIVGAAVRESGLARHEIFLTTKLFESSASYENAKRDIEKSLSALGTDYIDLLLIHEPYDASLEMYRALCEAYRAGTVRAVGISNFNEREYRAFCRSCGIIPAVNQVEAHVYYPREPLRRALVENSTVMQAWSPFTEGKRRIFEEPVLREIGAQHGKTAAQTALRFLVQRGIGVIPKTMHRERMQENLSVLDFELSDEEMERIGTLADGKSLFGWDED